MIKNIIRKWGNLLLEVNGEILMWAVIAILANFKA
jgi:hypothetical protein